MCQFIRGHTPDPIAAEAETVSHIKIPRLPEATMTPRHYPPPWSVEELDACFVVKDRDGQQLAYVYFEEEPGRRSAAKLLTKDAARRIPSEAGVAAQSNDRPLRRPQSSF